MNELYVAYDSAGIFPADTTGYAVGGYDGALEDEATEALSVLLPVEQHRLLTDRQKLQQHPLFPLVCKVHRMYKYFPSYHTPNLVETCDALIDAYCGSMRRDNLRLIGDESVVNGTFKDSFASKCVDLPRFLRSPDFMR